MLYGDGSAQLMVVTKNTEGNMGLLDKAKESIERAKDISLDLVSDENLASMKESVAKAKNISLDLVSDENLASMIMAACTKQDNVNEALKTKGSMYRIKGIDLVMGIPPQVVFSIRREFGD
jgi:hypothetical protein